MVIEINAADMLAGTTDDPGNVLFVVMFYSSGCGPCMHTAPHYIAAEEYFSQLNAPIKFHKMNVSENADNRAYYYTPDKSHGVPHFRFYYKESVLMESTGGGDLEAIKKLVIEAIDVIFKKYGDRL